MKVPYDIMGKTVPTYNLGLRGEQQDMSNRLAFV